MLNTPDQLSPLGWAWTAKLFLKAASEAEEATNSFPVHSCQQQTHNSFSFCSSSLLSAAWYLACFIYSSLFREPFCAFREISPGFWLCSMGKEAKYNSKLACCENSYVSADRKKNDAMLWLVWIFEMESCVHFLVYIILFLLHSFTQNTLAAKSSLSSPEKNKIDYLCNLTKFKSPKKKKEYLFHSSKNRSTPV